MTSIVDIAVPLSEHESAAASRLVDCEICFEAVPDADCLAIAGCGHKFCTLCVKVCDMALVVACSELIPPRCLVWSCLVMAGACGILHGRRLCRDSMPSGQLPQETRCINVVISCW